MVPIALALFYTYWRLLESQPQLRAPEQALKVAALFCWLGTTTLAALVRFELLPDWVATGWAALALALAAVACLGQRVFLHQALLLSFGILFRTVLHNFYQRSYFPPDSFAQSRWLLVGSTVALMFLALPILFKLRTKSAEGSPGGKIFSALVRRPEQLFFFIAVALLTSMLALETSRGMVTLAWAVEGLAIFLMALGAGERSFRLTGLSLLMLCFAKILFKDVWQLQKVSDRYLTFIVLGAAMVLMHFLYNRYREKIKRYL